MPKRDIVVIGGSAWALGPLKKITAELPADLAAAVFIVIHIPADFPSALPQILDGAGKLPAKHAVDGEKIEPGHIYIAPPDRHLTLRQGRLEVKKGPRENRHRPAIDPLFRTAARAYGARVIAVVLSGQLDDGSAGLMAVRMRGGRGIVQDPLDAQADQMPREAIKYAGVDQVLPASEIASAIVSLTHETTEPEREARDKVAMDIPDDSHMDLEHADGNEQAGEHASVFACPECHGVLFEFKDGELMRFRCRVGHAYTSGSLAGEMSASVESALWAAMRALEEKAALTRRMSEAAPREMAARLRDQAGGDEAHAETIKKILMDNAAMQAEAKSGGAA